MAAHDSSTRAILYAFLANLGIAIAKGLAAAYTGSGSMLAEAIHSAADAANQVLLFVGLRRARRPPTRQHPLGHGKVIFVWSFLVAILLFSLGGLFSIFEGAHKLGHPEALHQPWVAIAVLVVSIGLESGSLAGALREIRRLRGDRTVWQWSRTSRRAELVVVLGEDVAALLGLGIALAFVLLAALTGNPAFDAVGSIAIGAILLVISLFLIVRVKSLLIGHSADPELESVIRAEIAGDENVLEVFHVISIQYGPDVMLAAKIRMKPAIPVRVAAQAINRIEAKIAERFPEVRWTFIEPDVAD